MSGKGTWLKFVLALALVCVVVVTRQTPTAKRQVVLRIDTNGVAHLRGLPLPNSTMRLAAISTVHFLRGHVDVVVERPSESMSPLQHAMYNRNVLQVVKDVMRADPL